MDTWTGPLDWPSLRDMYTGVNRPPTQSVVLTSTMAASSESSCPISLSLVPWFSFTQFFNQKVCLSAHGVNCDNVSKAQTFRFNPSLSCHLTDGISLMFPGSAVCGNTSRVCPYECVPDLFSGTGSPSFTCVSPTGGGAAVSDTTYAGILSLIVVLSVLLVGGALWWWKDVFKPSRTLTFQDFSLKESQDPLIHGP